MIKPFVFLICCFLIFKTSFSQVDTSFVYNQETPYGTLDIRLAKSATRYYYLQENITFSFRESSPGVRTNTFKDMTAWDSSPYSEGNLREKAGEEDNFVMNYRLLKPANYDPNNSKSYPLIILFHGSGEKGNCWNSNCFWSNKDYDPVVNSPAAPKDPNHELLNNDDNLLHGGKVYLDAVNLAGGKLPDDPTLDLRAFPGFILIPQNLNGWTGNAVQDALRILRLVEKKYRINPDKVYLNGLSNGAHGAFEAMKRAPWLFTSAIMMSAVDDGFITNVGLESSVSRIPMWIFQGEFDKTPYPAKTKMYMKIFRDAGSVIRYTEYAGVGHTTWNKAYKEPDFFSWLLGTNMNAIHIFAGNAAICNKEGGSLPLQLPAGFLAYQWEKDGQIIAGANAFVYEAKTPGKYRARFSRISPAPNESQWNAWSPPVTVTTQNPPQAEVNQVGTLMLNDLNNGTTAYLEANGNFAHYYWYKNGNVLDLPGNEDDTLKTIAVPKSTGAGAYTLVVSNFDNCTSAPTPAKNIFFDNLAPITITAPSEFAVSKATASTVTLQWKDNSSDETGFEIWRRKRNATAFDQWVMPAIVNAGATSFTDTQLFPESTYQYKIRAVSNSARSNYTPAAASEALEAKTIKDTTPPAAPEVSVSRIGVDRIVIKWEPANDDTGIREYKVSYADQTFSVSGADTSLLAANLAIDTEYAFSVAAVDFSGNTGPASEPIHVLTAVNGLFYDHSPGYFPSLDSVDFSQPEYRGVVHDFTLAEKTQEDYFYFRFDGFLYITKAGSYKFRISSDDGSRLYILKKLIANNNGIHNLKSVQSTAQSLSKGPNRITADFFEYNQSDTLFIEYSGPDTQNQWKVISSDVLRGEIVIAAEPTIENALMVNVFPNPANEQNINIQVFSESRFAVGVQLLDPIGQVVYANQFDVNEAKQGIKLTTEGKLTNGIYFIRINQGEKIVQRKLLIKN
jgi:hypothetical protein